jgi:cation-transporting ATPase E
MLRSIMHFVLPAAFTVTVVALGAYLTYLLKTGDVAVARTALNVAAVLCGLFLIPFVQPPTPLWVGGDELSGDWRPAVLALALLVVYGVIMAVPGLRSFFGLVPLRSLDFLGIGAVVVIWAIALRTAWRTRLFERLLGLT